MFSLSQKIKLILKQKNLTQYKLAKRWGCNRGNLGTMINGKNPFPPEILEKLLTVLEVTKEEFTSWTIADKYGKAIIARAIECDAERHSALDAESQGLSQKNEDPCLPLTQPSPARGEDLCPCHADSNSSAGSLARKQKQKQKANKASKVGSLTHQQEHPFVRTTKIDAILEKKNLSRTNLSTMIKYSQSGFNRMVIGEINLSMSVVKKIAPIIEESENEIVAWILADKYPINLLKMALSAES